MDAESAAKSDDEKEVIYVSWGGTGRGAALRAAYERAADSDRGLVYLAILDPPHFKDLDGPLLATVVEELEWLLESHVRMVKAAAYRSIPTRVVVRTGEVDDEVEYLAKAIDAELVLVGAPVAASKWGSIDEMVASLRSRTGATVELVDGSEGEAKV